MFIKLNAQFLSFFSNFSCYLCICHLSRIVILVNRSTLEPRAGFSGWLFQNYSIPEHCSTAVQKKSIMNWSFMRILFNPSLDTRCPNLWRVAEFFWHSEPLSGLPHYDCNHKNKNIKDMLVFQHFSATLSEVTRSIYFPMKSHLLLSVGNQWIVSLTWQWKETQE